MSEDEKDIDIESDVSRNVGLNVYFKVIAQKYLVKYGLYAFREMKRKLFSRKRVCIVHKF